MQGRDRVSYCSALGGGGWGEEQLLEMFVLLLAVEVLRDVTHPCTSEASQCVASENTRVLLCECVQLEGAILKSAIGDTSSPQKTFFSF